jgi:MFS transporter, DHA2 family, multidrug resistance protein
MDVLQEPRVAAPVAPGLSRRQENAALVALTLPVLLISMDATILGFAVPRLSESLQPSSSELLWIIDVYSFVLAGLLITMGNIGDRIGRRRLLMIGAAGFSVASVAAAFAPSTLVLIAARAALGVAGATLMPSTLSLIRNIFVDARRRLFAIAVWATMFAVGSALGPMLGGLLLERFWWGSVFLIGVPVTLAVLVVVPLLVPESRDPEPAPFDVPSALLSMAGILPLVFAMKTLAEHGWTTTVGATLAIGTVSTVAFVRRQRRLPVPMIDISLFAMPKFRVAIAGNLLTCVGFAGSIFFITQYLQLVVGLSPLRAALQLLPGLAAAVAATLTAPALMRRFGPFQVISTGLAVGAGGFLLLTQLDGGSSLVLVTVGLVLIEAGLSAAITVAIDGIITSVPPEKAGAGASVSETANELGIALGTAVLGSIMTATYRRDLDGLDVPDASLTAARETLGAAHEAAVELGGAPGDLLRTASDLAFTNGLRLASLVAGVLLAGAAVASRRVARA